MSQTPFALDEAVHWRVDYRKGQIIYDEGEPSTSMYRLDQGCVRLQVNGLEGDRQIVTFLFKGDLFGFCLERRNSAAEAVTDVELTRYALMSVLELNARRPEIIVQLMNEANALYGDLAHHVEKITHLPASERVIWFLDWILRHRETKEAGTPIRLPMGHRDIADYLSLKPETLSRAIKQLENEGYLSRHGPRVFILTERPFAYSASAPRHPTVLRPLDADTILA